MSTYDFQRDIGLLTTIWRVTYSDDGIEDATLVHVGPKQWPLPRYDNRERYTGGCVGTLGPVPRDDLGEKLWDAIEESLSEDIVQSERLIRELEAVRLEPAEH